MAHDYDLVREMINLYSLKSHFSIIIFKSFSKGKNLQMNYQIAKKVPYITRNVNLSNLHLKYDIYPCLFRGEVGQKNWPPLPVENFVCPRLLVIFNMIIPKDFLPLPLRGRYCWSDSCIHDINRIALHSTGCLKKKQYF